MSDSDTVILHLPRGLVEDMYGFLAGALKRGSVFTKQEHWDEHVMTVPTPQPTNVMPPAFGQQVADLVNQSMSNKVNPLPTHRATELWQKIGGDPAVIEALVAIMQQNEQSTNRPINSPLGYMFSMLKRKTLEEILAEKPLPKKASIVEETLKKTEARVKEMAPPNPDDDEDPFEGL